MNEDLWGDINLETVFENNNIKKILAQQAELLSKKTNGKINALFSKIEYVDVPTMGMMQTLGTVASMVTSLRPMQEQEEIELLNQKDINERFKKTKYKFEIYNSTFRYRLFLLNYSEEFPVELEIDEGISEDMGIDKKLSISSNNEFSIQIKNIFSSRKVRLVLSRMLQDENQDNQEKELDFLHNRTEFVLKEYAEEMDVSIEKARRQIKHLEDQGLVKKIKSGRSLKWIINNGEK